MTGVPSPGAARLAVVLSAAVPAALAYPWRTDAERGVLGVAVVIVVVALGWWRGRPLTTMLGDRLRIMLRRSTFDTSTPEIRWTGTDAVTTVLLQVEDDDRPVPVHLLTGQLQRYGLACDAVRVTTRSAPAGVTTWIGLTFSAACNLAALQARSAQLPLRQTAETATRRLVEQLREKGWTATAVDDVPAVVAADAREHWQTVTDARGHVTSYVLDDVEAIGAVTADSTGSETWTVLEISGPPAAPVLRAAAAIRTEEPPAAATALPGLVAVPGRQAAALAALHPLSGARLVS
ncbi:type VII secretion protein EccE [Mycolicibacterium sp. CBM1]